jgi:hypothetical protein
MSFRKYGGVQFSSTNNYVYSQFTSSNTLGTTKFGYDNTTLPTLSVFNVDEAYIARLHIQDYIMFSDGSTQTTAYVSTDVPLLNANNVFTGANNTFNDITTHNIFVEPGYSITLRDASDNTSTSTLAQSAYTCLITNNAANGKISLQTRLNTGDPGVENIYCENGNHAVLQSDPSLSNPAIVDCLDEQITLYGNTPVVDTPPMSGDNSNKIATTGWVSDALDLSSYPTLAANNVFTGSNTFNAVTINTTSSSSYKLTLQDGSNNTTLVQSGATLTLANNVTSGSVVVSTNTSGGAPSNTLTLSSATTSLSSTNLSFTGTETHNSAATFNNNLTITSGYTLQILDDTTTPIGLKIYTSGGGNGNIWIEAVSNTTSGTRLNLNTSPVSGSSVTNMYLQNGNTVGIEGAASKGIYLTDGNINFYSDTVTFNNSTNAVTFKAGWLVSNTVSSVTYGTQAFQNLNTFAIQSTTNNGAISLGTKGSGTTNTTHLYMSGDTTAYIQGSTGKVECTGDQVNLYSASTVPTMTNGPTYPSSTTTQIASVGYVNAAISGGTSGYALLSASNLFTGTTNTFNAVTINTTSGSKLTLQDGSNNTTLVQSGATLTLANNVTSGSVVVSTNNSVGTSSNTLTATSNGLTVLRAVGQSAISEFIVKDSSGQQKSIEYIPQSTSQSVNPIIQADDAVMVAKGSSIDTNNSLSITNWSSTANGLRLANDSNTLTYSTNTLALTSSGLTYSGAAATFNTYVKITSGGSCQALNVGGGVGADFRVVNSNNNNQYTQWYQNGTASSFTTYSGGTLNFGDTAGTYLSVASSNVTIPNGATLQILGPNPTPVVGLKIYTSGGGNGNIWIEAVSTSSSGTRLNFNTAPAGGSSVNNMYLQNGNTVGIQAALNKGISLTDGNINFYSDTVTFNNTINGVTFKGGWIVSDSTSSYGTQAFQGGNTFTIQSTSYNGIIKLNTKGASPDTTEYNHLYMSGDNTAYIQGSTGKVECNSDQVNLYSASAVPTMTVQPTYPSSNSTQIASVGYVNSAINTQVLFVRGYKYFTSTNSGFGLCSIKFTFTNVSTITTSDTYTCRFTIRYDYNTSSSDNPNSTNSYTAYYGYLVMFPGRITGNIYVNGYLNNNFSSSSSSTTSSAYTAANRFYWTDDYVNKYSNPTSTAPSDVLIPIAQPSQSTPAISVTLYNPVYNATSPTAYNLSISVYFEVVNSSNSSLGVSASTSGFDNVQKTF